MHQKQATSTTRKIRQVLMTIYQKKKTAVIESESEDVDEGHRNAKSSDGKRVKMDTYVKDKNVPKGINSIEMGLGVFLEMTMNGINSIEIWILCCRYYKHAFEGSSWNNPYFNR